MADQSQPGLALEINGERVQLPDCPPEMSLTALIDALELQADRVAVELNRVIAPRTAWDTLTVRQGDRLEIVHFVGGGCSRR